MSYSRFPWLQANLTAVQKEADQAGFLEGLPDKEGCRCVGGMGRLRLATILTPSSPRHVHATIHISKLALSSEHSMQAPQARTPNKSPTNPKPRLLHALAPKRVNPNRATGGRGLQSRLKRFEGFRGCSFRGLGLVGGQRSSRDELGEGIARVCQ